MSSAELLELDEVKLAQVWTKVRNADIESHGFQVRGWYHELYREFMAGKKVLDVGCGFGISSISFAQMGASVTFVDIVESNVRLVEKVCRGLGIPSARVAFHHVRDSSDFASLPCDFDVVTAMGSLHNAPFEFMKPEVAQIVPHLKIGGRWLQLTYPRARWFREGSPSFSDWGTCTDGEGTPYCEWYDMNKLLQLLAPARFEPTFYCEWHNHDFNWFDLKLRAYDGAVLTNTEDPIWAAFCFLQKDFKEKEQKLDETERQLQELAVLEQKERSQFEELSSVYSEQHATLVSIQNSSGWKMLNRWYKLRERLAPRGTRRRRFYDGLRGAK